ncbi:hypothetical protein HK105_203303 [Polyrhizophydium stewartii]|uniref:TRAF3-interacting protein 1 n=1 Tax=Polyrhizophydium stewartii TaxID=2732419 RepID=A0ABR4NCK1_9FUNG
MADAPQQPAGQAPAPAAAQAAPASGLPPVLDELTKKTIDILGRVIKKPPLTQKLLAKPPFRYLHDIYSELIRTCGFVPGLYTEAEMNSDNIKDKDAKVAYLTKMIDCVGIATNIELRANPLKIVAGLEPEETNAMLQLIGKVVIKKVDTKNAVARVLAGEHQGKKPAAPAGAPASASAAAPAPTPAAASATQPAAAQAKAAAAAPAGNASAAATPAAAAPAAPGAAAGAKAPAPSTAAPAAAKPAASAQQPAPADQAKPAQAAASSAPAPAAKDGQQAKPQAPVPAPSSQPGAPAPSQPQPQQPAQAAATAPAPKPSTAAPKEAQPAAAAAVKPAPPKQEDAAKLSKAGSIPDVVPTEPSLEADPSAQEDSSADPRIPQATIKRRERPISARPAPPKQRPAEVAPEEAPTNTPAIISDGHHKDDEDDEFVVRAVEALKMVGRFVWEYVEAGFRLTRALLNQNPDIRGSTPQLDEKHGGLVQKILQTKKDLEARAPGEGGADSDEARRSTGATGAPSGRETRSSALKEIEALRESIQLLCQSTNPLGKTMDYMQEDVDSMNKELDMWRKECHAFKQLLESETKQSAAAEGQSGAVQGTLESLAPLEQQLKSFEDGIEDQLERIASAKAVILQNDSSIQKILRNITVAGKMDS